MICAALALAGCDGLALDTPVADSPVVRRIMAESVVIGHTTEMDLITRWGRPTQKVRQGGQTEYIYRRILDGEDFDVVQFGDSTRYVIVTFQYGIAAAVRTNDSEGCRATFAPRPPGMAYANPGIVTPIETCPGIFRPAIGTGPLSAIPALAHAGDGADPGLATPVLADEMPGAGPDAGKAPN